MNWRRSMIGLSVAAPIVGLLAFGLTRDPGEITSPLPGKPAPDFALEYMDGAGVASLESLRGQVIVVNFWASWCLECRYEHRDLSDAAELYEGKGVRFLGVLYDDKPANARRWIEAMGGQSYPSVLDEGSRTAIDFGLYGVPETFIIDRSGTVVFKRIGPTTLEELRAVIDPLVADASAE